MKTIGIFCGGFSSEYAISMNSAETIVSHFPKGYSWVKIKVKKGRWETETNDGIVGYFDLNTGNVQNANESIPIDAGLIYIHGNPGENGKIQGLLDMLDIPYINADALSSSLSFDKWYCNQFLRAFKIPVASSIFLRKGDAYNTHEMAEALGLPLFIKPTNSGSSYGISKVKEEDQIDKGIQTAFREGDSIVLESFLSGTEVTCGVYRTKKGLQALPLAEIVSQNEFFDYEAKYLGQSEEIVPARIDEALTLSIQELSKRIYALLHLRSIARIDFIVCEGKPYVIEVNTTPGFSTESIVPKMLACAGISICDFWTEIFDVELVTR
jgi:D-alanine-D-alanine ligase